MFLLRKYKDSIKLDSPYKCEFPLGVAGYVPEITPDFIVIELKKASSEPIKEDQLVTLESRSGKRYQLSGRLIMDTGDSGRFVLSDEESKDLLKEVIGSIRKNQHIDICKNQDIESSDHYTGFSDVELLPEALPELNYQDLNIERSFLGHSFKAPILITGMTGGVEEGERINRNLASIAEQYQIPMGVGSQRIAIEDNSFKDIFTLKKSNPNIFLIANIGCGQLTKKEGIEYCQRAVEMINADALAIHLNVLQECIQVEGDKNFEGILERIYQICDRTSVPIIVKEVGCGISPVTARKLIEAGVSSIDVGGKGGTSWGYIEGLRSSSTITQKLSQTFRNWGMPTAYSLKSIRNEFPTFPLIATGGIRDGLTVAKALALGANMVGVGLPFFKAAIESEEKLHETMEVFIRGLKIAMMITGSTTIDNLRTKMYIIK